MIATQAVTEPFPGLRPFTAQESALFFGRDEQVEELLVRLATRRFLAVVGTSGSGKSSLVRAGLIPTVERGHLGTPGSRWVIATLSRPGLDPLHGLACALMEAFELEELELNKIEAELNRSSVGLSGFAGRHLRANERLLVFVDQFEELFRYRKQAGEEGRVKSTAFVKLLLAATGHSDAIPLAPGEPIYVVLTMRSDYLGKCAQFRGLPEALNDSQYLVPQMSRDQLREAIEGPVALAGAEISDALVDRLLNDARNDADLLPILQHALFRVWEESSESRAAGLPLDIRHYDDERIRGFNQALNLDAEAAFDKVKGDPGKREIARRMFQRIVEPGAEDEESRRPTRLSEIAAVCHTSGAEVRDVIEVFQSRRFVTLSDDDDPLVDISHESLIRQWRQLKAWANEEAQSASVYRRLAYEAVHGGASYRGRNLAEALLWEKKEAPNSAWAARYTGESGTFQKAIEFLRTSQRRERWQSAMFVFLFLTLAVAVFSLYLLLRSEQQKRVFKSLQLAAIAQLNRNIVSDRALLLGIQAYKTDRTVGARSALLTDLESNPGLLIYLHQSAPLHGVAFSRDGVTLASASEDNTVQLWNLVTGRPLGGPLRGHTGPVLSVAFSPDGKILASASADETVRLWDVAKRQVLGNPLQGGKDPVWSVAFSPDGKRLASASGEIHSSDGKTPAWASGAVQLWNVETHEAVGGPLEAHRGPEWSVAFSPDGKTLASGSGWMQPEEGRRAGRAIGAVQLWDVSKGQFLGELLKAHSGPVRSVAFSPDGKTLAAASEDNTVQLWDVSKRQPVGEPLEGHENYVSSVAFSPDGKWLASASQDNTVQLWDLTTRQPQPLAEPLHHDSYVSSVAFSPDSKTLASASDDKTVRLWDVTLRQHLGKQLEGHQGYVSSVAFSPDGKTLASGSDDKTIQLWDVPHPEALGEPLRGHTDSVLNVAFSPDGKMLASAAGDQTIRLWDVARRQPLGVLRGHTDSVWSVAFSPDGKTLASASWDKTVRLWDVASRRPLGEPLRGHTDSVLSVAFSPDGKMLASASVDKTVRLWDVASRKPVGAPLQRHRGAVRSVAFSPDGKILASTGDDKAVQMWDVATQRQLGEPLQGHTLPVYNAVFSPDGNTLASASLDKTVRLWDVASREPVGAPLQGHTNWVLSVAFSPDGKTLASASVDETVRLWDIDPDYWVSRTCAMVDRNLSAAEWKQYVGTDTPYQKTCPKLPPGEGAPGR